MPCTRQPLEGICLMSSEEMPVCRQMMEKKLPCNHLARVECSVPAEKVFCNETCDHVLGCRHSVPTKCGVSLEKRLLLSCPSKEEKELPCGHKFILKCGSDEASKPLNSLYCR